MAHCCNQAERTGGAVENSGGEREECESELEKNSMR